MRRGIGPSRFEIDLGVFTRVKGGLWCSMRSDAARCVYVYVLFICRLRDLFTCHICWSEKRKAADERVNFNRFVGIPGVVPLLEVSSPPSAGCVCVFAFCASVSRSDTMYL